MATRAQLIEAMKRARTEGGWLTERRPYGITLRKVVERETPPYVPDRWWPGPTHLSGLWLTVDIINGKVNITARTWACPWVRPSDRSLSMQAAIDFLLTEPG